MVETTSVSQACLIQAVFSFAQQSYEHLFKVNDKSVGGSFYLQSKVRNVIMEM